jgi:large subunit GTPase 1
MTFSLVARGYTRSGQGNPDEARAARYILKDFVNAKILYCHPPPGISEVSFNERTHELALLRSIDKKRAPVTRVGKGADTFVPSNVSGDGAFPVLGQGHKSQAVDRDFFTNTSNLAFRPFVQGSARNGQEYSRAKLFPHQNAVANDGSALTGGRAQIASVSTNSGEGNQNKKHHKRNKRVKQRSGKGYDV